MTIQLRRKWCYIVLGVSILAVAQPISAQQPRLDPPEIGQIVDTVLDTIVPPDRRLSRVSVAERGILFDYEWTMKAFGYSETAGISRSELGLRRVVKNGSESQLADCVQLGNNPCSKLGWGVHVRVHPLSLTSSNAVVRVNVKWADRGPAAFEDRVTPSGSAILVGFASEVHLARKQDGTWEYVRQGPTMVF